MLRNPALHEKRHEQILAEVVRVYIESGEPVSSRTIAQRHAETLSPATIRSVMADLEDQGYLYQPHTSAGRLPTAMAYRFFVEHFASQAQLGAKDEAWIRTELGAASTAEELAERAGHILATVSRGLGIILSPPVSRTVLEHVRFLLLPDSRILVVLISRGGAARDKLIATQQKFSQAELDRTADYLNRHYQGCTLEAIRGDLMTRLTSDRERYDQLANAAALLWDPHLLGSDVAREVYVEGAAQIATMPEFTDQNQLRELLAAIEEKRRLVELLTSCIEAPEPVHVQIGVKEISSAGEKLALISAPYACGEQVQGSVGILGPLRMPYERAITVAAFLAHLLSISMTGENPH